MKDKLVKWLLKWWPRVEEVAYKQGPVGGWTGYVLLRPLNMAVGFRDKEGKLVTRWTK